MTAPIIPHGERLKLASKAHHAVRLARLNGDLPEIDASTACVDCGSGATEYDHRDYRRPLDVAPVCSACNTARGPALPYWKPRDAEAGIETHGQILRLLGITRMSIKIGVSAETIRKWERRDAIPARYWLRIAALSADEGLPADLQRLAEIAAQEAAGAGR